MGEVISYDTKYGTNKAHNFKQCNMLSNYADLILFLHWTQKTDSGEWIAKVKLYKVIDSVSVLLVCASYKKYITLHLFGKRDEKKQADLDCIK